MREQEGWSVTWNETPPLRELLYAHKSFVGWAAKQQGLEKYLVRLKFLQKFPQRKLLPESLKA
ncbi:MAG: hypothetical protein DRR08_08550 [Candidatus Parabeggiatoa sp. nov. 2]|nr:MAG: hypothetical protein B6247_01950 [Beggiatoa sp. 4572_84]RKZ61509.1 MAG: hypothetical protein DRR08_08550 [Gammaproteobacteria bacterium]